MPGIDEIRATWDSPEGWTSDGDEWSGRWGGSEPLWWGTLLPRIHSFVPTGTVLELGPGHGRWSHYLKDLCEDLTLVDVAPDCIDSCRVRFKAATNLTYHVGDGYTLPFIEDHSIDFAFSFDSLVHAEADVLEAYAAELGRVLKPDGIAFLHHSNMGAHRRAATLARRVPDRLRRRMVRRGLLVNVYAWRAESTTAEAFTASSARAGLSCVGQELIAWEYGRQLTDVISLLTPRGSRWDRPKIVVENPGFVMREARGIASIAPLYSGGAAASSRSNST